MATASGVAPAELQRLAGHKLTPLKVTVNGQGPPGGGGDTCVTAANSAHVTAGRAAAFFIWVWAAGSGEYIGATWDTTALQGSGTTWRKVASC